MRIRKLLLAAMIAGVASGDVIAQEFRGTIAGTVTDTSGGVIAGASVEARNIDTGATAKTTTNSSGTYVLPFLAIGHYKITASQTGFKNSVQNDVELRITDRIQVDFKMEVGATSEQVTVSAGTGSARNRRRFARPGDRYEGRDGCAGAGP